MAGTWNGKTWDLYLHGKHDGTDATGGAFNRTGPHGPVKVYKQPFDGVIDEVAMYDRAMTVFRETETAQSSRGRCIRLRKT